MTLFFRTVLFLTLIQNLACAAKDSENSQESVDSTSQAVITARSGDPIFNLKNLMITSEYVFPDGENVRGAKMDAAAISKFKPESIDEFFARGDTYYVLDTIATSSAGSVYLILKYEQNETSGWLVIYDRSMKVKDQIEVYYENAEGNFYLTSSILDNIVTTNGDNVTPEESPVSAFKIIEGPRWQIIEH